MNIEEQARQILNREPVAQVEAFLNAFTELMRAMAQRMLRIPAMADTIGA